MDFSSALALLKEGCKITREVWQDPDMFIYFVTGGTYKTQMDCIKEYSDKNGCLTYSPYFAFYNGKTGLVNIWIPNIVELLATDWTIA